MMGFQKVWSKILEQDVINLPMGQIEGISRQPCFFIPIWSNSTGYCAFR